MTSGRTPVTDADSRVPLVRLGQSAYRRDLCPEDLGLTETHPPSPIAHCNAPADYAAKDPLTSTRLATLRRCPKQHHFRYELGLSRVRTSDALRLGAAFHRGLELHNRGGDAAASIDAAIATVLYDVARKPTILPLRATPPDKRKYTKDGRLYAAQREGDETPEEFGGRLLADIGDRPDYYFQRREVPRLEDELAEFQIELWQQAKQLLDSRRHGRWFRNVQRFTCGTCEFADLCFQSVHLAAGTKYVVTLADCQHGMRRFDGRTFGL